MADEKYTFEQARIRLEEIAVEVRKKDTSLEKSLDLLEEGVRLANICTELVDHTDVGATVTTPAPERATDVSGEEPTAEPEGRADEPEATPEATDDEADGFDETDDEVDEPTDSGSDD